MWSNFPSVGAEHRARLVNEILAPAIVGRAVTEPSEIFEAVTQGTSVLALQSGGAVWDDVTSRYVADLTPKLDSVSIDHATLPKYLRIWGFSLVAFCSVTCWATLSLIMFWA